MHKAKEIAAILLDANAVRVSIDPPFTWTSGIKSPVYCDNRKMISYPAQRSEIVAEFKDMMNLLHDKPDFIAGTATAAIPWAAFLAQELNLPMVYIRPEKKEHGAGKQVEGDLPPGKKVLIVEDLISTGGSSIKAAQAVESECKGVVTDVFAIVTWELDEAKEHFNKAGIRLSTLTNFTNIIGLALERGVITEDQWSKIIEFKRSPRDWAGKVGIK